MVKTVVETRHDAYDRVVRVVADERERDFGTSCRSFLGNHSCAHSCSSSGALHSLCMYLCRAGAEPSLCACCPRSAMHARERARASVNNNEI